MRWTTRIASCVAVLGAATAACSGDGASALRTSDQVVGANPGESAALYVDIANHGDVEDSLLGASCTCAERTSLHVTEDRDGILMMAPTDELDLPAGTTVELHPGGSHIMLEGLQGPLTAGSTVEVSLEFARSTPIAMEVPVVPLEDLPDRFPRQ